MLEKLIFYAYECGIAISWYFLYYFSRIVEARVVFTLSKQCFSLPSELLVKPAC